MTYEMAPSVFSCIAVSQPVGTFYVMSASARNILRYLTVSRRGLTAVERDKVQRALDPVRQKEIAKYVTRDEATFPTSITVNADSECVSVVETPTGLVIVFGREVDANEAKQHDQSTVQVIESKSGQRCFVGLDSGGRPAEIIDGQHRFEGLSKAIRDANGDAELRERLELFELTLAIMFDLVPEQCAKVFVTINATQRKVDSSHIADLFALHSVRSPQRVSHLIAVAANELDASPFRGGLKMLGKRTSEGQYLSQGSFSKYLMTLLPKSSESGELVNTSATDATLEARPFFELYMDGQDKKIAQIVLDYFSAVADVYPVAWFKSSDAYLIRKTVGFAALIKLLRKLLPTMLPNGWVSFRHFEAVLVEIKKQYPEEKWKVGEFSSSDSDAGKVASAMYVGVANKMREILTTVEK